MILKTERLRDDEKIIKILNTDQLNPIMVSEALKILEKYMIIAMESDLYGLEQDTILVILSVKIFLEFYKRYLEAPRDSIILSSILRAFDRIWPDICIFLPKNLKDFYIKMFIDAYLQDCLIDILNKNIKNGSKNQKTVLFYL